MRSDMFSESSVDIHRTARSNISEYKIHFNDLFVGSNKPVKTRRKMSPASVCILQKSPGQVYSQLPLY